MLSIIFSSESRQLCHKTVKFWVQKGGQIIKIPYFLSNADVSINLLNFNVLIDNQEYVFHQKNTYEN